jgi:hypothetical protein
VFSADYGQPSTRIIAGKDGDQALDVYLCSNESPEQIAQYMTIAVFEHVIPILGFVQQMNQSTPPTTPVPVSYTQENPTKYVIDLTNPEPMLLVLAETYNTKWHMFAHEQSTNPFVSLLPDLAGAPPSYTVNGYASSWFVSGDTQKYTLEFVPQRVMYAGIHATAIGLVLGGIMIFLFRKRL